MGEPVRVPSGARSLYGKLLAIAPAFLTLSVGDVLCARPPALELRVLGISGAFRRLELVRIERDLSDELVPSPCVQMICDVELQAACVVEYSDPYSHPASFVSRSSNVLQPPNRLVTALAGSLLDAEIGFGCMLAPRVGG